MTPSEDQIKRMLDEAAAGATARHPNIERIRIREGQLKKWLTALEPAVEQMRLTSLRMRDLVAAAGDEFPMLMQAGIAMQTSAQSYQGFLRYRDEVAHELANIQQHLIGMLETREASLALAHRPQ